MEIHNELVKQRVQLYKSTISLTTCDSYTLTDGPTIYMTNDVNKMSKFCLQIAKIPSGTLDEIHKNIEYNNSLSIKIKQMEKDGKYSIFAPGFYTMISEELINKIKKNMTKKDKNL